MTTTIQEIRKANLMYLIADSGLLKQEFAAKLNIAPAYLSQIITGHRNVGGKVARRIEEAFNLQKGWLDQSHTTHQTNVYVTKFLSLPEDLRAEAIRQIDLLIDIASRREAPEENQEDGDHPVGDEQQD